MKAGAVVRYVDEQNTERYGVLQVDAVGGENAIITPLEDVPLLDPENLLSRQVVVVPQHLAGGPPYWVADNILPPPKVSDVQPIGEAL